MKGVCFVVLHTFFVAALAALIWSLRAAYSSSDRFRVSRYLELGRGYLRVANICELELKVQSLVILEIQARTLRKMSYIFILCCHYMFLH